MEEKKMKKTKKKKEKKEKKKKKERNWASLLSRPRRRTKPAPTQHVDGK